MTVISKTGSSYINYGNDMVKAVQSNDIKSAEELLLNGVSPETGLYGRSFPVITAVENGYFDMAMLLLDYGADPVRALETAARKGSVKFVRAIVSRLRSCAHPTETYSEVLRCAASEGHTEVCRELIKSGADVNYGAGTSYGATPLMLAAGTGNTELIKILIAAGAGVDTGNRGGETPLAWAACRNCPKGVAAMLAAGADPNSAKKGDHSPFFNAVRICSLESIRLLIDAGADINRKVESGRSELIDAINSAVHYWGNDFSKKETMEAMELLFGLVDVKGLSQEEKNILLSDAAKINYIPGAAMALNAGAEINSLYAEKYTSFYIAVENGNTEMVKFLADAGADVSCKYKSKNALVAAIECGKVDIARMLAKKGVTLGKGERKKAGLMVKAAKSGYSDVIRLLAENGVSPDAVVKEGMTWTPLFYAAYGGESDAIKVLAEIGADIDRKDRNGDTALSIACSRGHLETVKTLLELGADPFVTNSGGRSVLISAAEKNKGPLCRLLMSYGVDPAIADSSGNTALHHIAKHGAVLMMRTMLLAGADLNAENQFGDTPMSLLKEYAPGMYKKYADRLMSFSSEARRLASEDKSGKDLDFTGFEFDI